MNSEDQENIEEILRLTRANHSMLKSIRGSQRTAQMIHGIYWLIIIGILVAVFYYVKPYVAKITALYNEGNNAVHNINLDSISKDLNPFNTTTTE